MTPEFEELLETIDGILDCHQFETNRSGARWCDKCLPNDRIPMPYSWRNCEMNELRAARDKIREVFGK